MRIFPVMGTALINAHDITKKINGSLLLLDARQATGLSNRDIVTAEFSDFVVIDWIHAGMREIRQIIETASIAIEETQDLEQQLRIVAAAATAKCSVSAKWVKNTLSFNGCG